MNTEQLLRNMRTVVEEHRDPKTGEVSATTLAEAACAHFAAWDGDDVPEEFFEAALVVADEDDKRRKAAERKRRQWDTALFAEKHINYEADGDVIWQ